MPYLRRQVVPVVVALCVSLLLALLVANVIVDFRLTRETSDIYAYVRNYDRYERLYFGRSLSELEFLLYEVHFHYWFQELSDFIGDPIDVLRGITFLSCFTFAFASMYRDSWRLAPVLLILSHPRFLDFVSSQQRLSFALTVCVLAILLCGYFFARAVLFLVAASFHTYVAVLLSATVLLILSHPRFLDFVSSQQRLSFALTVCVLAILLCGYFFARAVLFLVAASFHTYVAVLLSATVLYTIGVWREWRYRYVLLLGVGLVAVAVVLAPLILGILGDRRADSEGGATGMLYTAMWLGTYAVFGFLYKKRLNSIFGFLFMFSALSALAAFAVDAYSERYISLSIVFMALSGVVRDLRRDGVFFCVYTVNVGVSYAYWLR